MAVTVAPSAVANSARDDAVMDTRTSSPVPRGSPVEATAKEPPYNPDLSAEVAMLSTKLVNAINYQTNLDDSLQQARHELDQAHQRIAQLEEEKARHTNMVSSGVLVLHAEINKTILQLRSELDAERAARQEVERGKKQVESELENLTTALFEEANSMVAAARKDTEAMEKRNSQLRNQLQECELLMVTQQEQLTDLKGSMKKMEIEPMVTRDSSVPSTPITGRHSPFDALQGSPSAASTSNLSPEHPLHFSSLINPVLRSDTKAYEDFQDLLSLARRLGIQSYSGNTHSVHPVNTAQGATASSTGGHSASNGSVHLASSGSGSVSAPSGSSVSVPPLKDSRFYKRVLMEDIEPTLRLDIAPGLSFLSRRSVLSSLLQGTLAVEPYPQNKDCYACTLCGDGKRQEQHIRRHRFRVSEDDHVPKPLCDFCCARLRATCDFVGFLRMVRDGYWRSDNEEDQRAAWEESVRLREKMFWARLGGGVVPRFHLRSGPPSPQSALGFRSARQSLEGTPEAPVDRNPHRRPKSDDGNCQECHTASVDVSARSSPDAITKVVTSGQENEQVLAVEMVHLQDFQDCELSSRSKPEVKPQIANTAGSSAPPTFVEGTNKQRGEISALGLQITTANSPPAPHVQMDTASDPALPQNTSPASRLLDSREPLRTSKTSSVLARVRAMEAVAN